MKPEMGLRHYGEVLHKRAWIVAVVVVLAMVAAVCRLSTLSPQYRAESSILVTPHTVASSALDGSGLSSIRRAYRETFLNDVIQLVRSRTVLERVARSVGGLGVKDLARHETVRNLPDTDFLIIGAVDGQPERAALIANATAEEFINFYTQINRADATSSRKFIEEQLGLARDRLGAAEQAAAEFRIRTGTSGALPGDASPTVQRIVDLQAAYDAATLDASVARTRADAIRSHLASQNDGQLASISIATNPVIVQIRGHLTGLELQLADLRGMYTDQHPKVQTVLAAIAADRERLRAEAKNVLSNGSFAVSPTREQFVREMINGEVDAAAAQARAAGISSILGRFQSGLNNVTKNEVTLARLQREARVAEQLYTRLSSLREDALIRETAAGSEPAAVVVVDPAVAPDRPVPTPLPAMATFGGLTLLGLIAGAALALGVEALEDRKRRAPQAGRAYGVPALTAISIALVVLMLGVGAALYFALVGVAHANVIHSGQILRQVLQTVHGLHAPFGTLPVLGVILGATLAVAGEAVEGRIQRVRAGKAYGVPMLTASVALVMLMLGVMARLYVAHSSIPHANVIHSSQMLKEVGEALTQAFRSLQ